MSIGDWLKATLRLRRDGIDKANSAAPAQPLPDAEAGARARQEFENGRAAFAAGDYGAAAGRFEAAIAMRHDDADAHNYLGVCRLRLGDDEDAADCFAMALHHRPGFAQALNNLALVAQRAGRLDEAVDYLEQALARDPRLALAHNDLGYLLAHELSEFERGAAHIETALKLAPDNPDVLCNFSMLLVQRGSLDEAIAVCDRLLAASPDMHEARLNRSLAMLKLGRFAEAWPDYESRKLARSNFIPRSLSLPDWQGQPLANRRLLVYAEQGIGDQMMFASCLPELLRETGACIVECAPKLVSLFRRSFPLARIEPQQGDDRHLAGLVQAARFDFKVAIGSLPRFFRKDASAFPHHAGYLQADPGRVKYWRERLGKLGPEPKIGISWFGGALTTGRDARSTRLDDWLPVLRQPCHFVSLQYGRAQEELEAFTAAHALTLHHWNDALDDYDETAALVAALDQIVSVQTALAHLTGALGKAGWIALPAIAEWRYLQSGESMPWYPSLRLFRQQRPGDWASVTRSIAQELSVQLGFEPCDF